jgi:hypothetical protein
MNAPKITYSELPMNCPGCGRRFTQDDRWVSVMRRIALGVLIGLPVSFVWGFLFTKISGIVFLPKSIVAAFVAIALYGWPLFLMQWIGRRIFWPSARLKCGKCPYDESFLIDPETIPDMYDKK